MLPSKVSLTSPSQGHRGFTMMELVVVLFLMVMFQLCIANGFLRINAVKADVDQRRQAILLVHEYIQRSRINRQLESQYFENTLGKPDEPAFACDVRLCLPQDLINFDMHWFHQSLQDLEPDLSVEYRNCLGGSSQCLIIESESATRSFRPLILPINFSHLRLEPQAMPLFQGGES